MIFLYAGNVQGIPLGLWCQNLHSVIRTRNLWLLLVPPSLMVELLHKADSPGTSVPPLSLSIRISSIQPLCVISQVISACFTCLHSNARCSSACQPFGRTDLKDLHKFSVSQPKKVGGKKNGIKHSDFSPHKTGFKNSPCPSLFMLLHTLQQVFTAELCSSPRNCSTALEQLKCKWTDPNLGRCKRNGSDVTLNTYGNVF